MKTEYVVVGEGEVVREEARPLEASLDQQAGTPEPEPPPVAEPAYSDSYADDQWAHHGPDGRVNLEAVESVLAQVDASPFSPALKEALRKHLLSHQRAMRAIEQRRSLRRG